MLYAYLFISLTLDFNLKKKLVKCYIWSISLYGAETWTLRKYTEKDGKNHMDRSSKNKEVLCKEDRSILPKVKRRKANWIGHILRRKCLRKHVIEGNIEGRK